MRKSNKLSNKLYQKYRQQRTTIILAPTRLKLHAFNNKMPSYRRETALQGAL